MDIEIANQMNKFLSEYQFLKAELKNLNNIPYKPLSTYPSYPKLKIPVKCSTQYYLKTIIGFAVERLAKLKSPNSRLQFFESFLIEVEQELSSKFQVHLNDTEVYRTEDSNFYVREEKFWIKKGPKDPLDIQQRLRDAGSILTFGKFDPPHFASVVDIDTLHSRYCGHEPLKKENINIALYPLSKNRKCSFDVSRELDPLGKYAFISKAIQLTAIEKEEIDECIRSIRGNDIDIACFPELSVCDNSLDYLVAKIKEANDKFFILIGGSFHHNNENGDYKNQMPIIIFYKDQVIDKQTYSKEKIFEIKVREGDLDFISQLFNNFKDKVSQASEDNFSVILAEDIIHDYEMLIFKTLNYGNFGFAICKDFVPEQTSICQLAESYSKLVDHMIIVSFNRNPNASFEALSAILARRSWISTFYVNAGVIDSAGKCPSFYRIPLYKNSEAIFIGDNDALISSQIKIPQN